MSFSGTDYYDPLMRKYSNLDWSNVLDHVGLMTYDATGNFDTCAAGQSSLLSNSNTCQQDLSMQGSVAKWRNASYAPLNMKVYVGVAFYGRFAQRPTSWSFAVTPDQDNLIASPFWHGRA